MSQPHSHEPWAEIDSDGMWEPACSGCAVFLDPAINSLTQRYVSRDDAVAAARAVITMLKEEGDD